MDAFSFLFTFRIIAFSSFFFAFTVYWILKNKKESMAAALDAVALLLIKFPFRPAQDLLRAASRTIALLGDGTARLFEMISVFSRAFYRVLFSAVQRAGRYARREYLPVPLVGALFFAGAAGVSVFVQKPQPNAHDEFGYLLQADTFARGHLANPPHPLWRHFESFHILQRPSYAAKYPPAQGLFLAVGQILTGEPVSGVWLSFALMMAVLYWALKAFFSPGWALIGTVLAGVRTGFVGQPALINGFGYWSQSYWGGAVAAFGGALLFGAFRRMTDHPSVRHSVLMGLGLAVLANSRPFEGLLAALPLAVAFFLWIRKEGRLAAARKTRLLLPIAAILALTAAWMGYYNWRVTGDPWKTPYQAHETAYGMPPLFVGQKTEAKTSFRHAVQNDYYGGYVQRLYEYHSTPRGFVDLTFFKIKQNGVFFFGALLVVPLLFLRKEDLLKDLWPRLFGAALLSVALGEAFVERLSYPHYVAPVTFPLYFFVVLGLSRLGGWTWRRWRLGAISIGILLVVSVGEVLIPLRHLNEIPACSWHRERARLLRELTAAGGRHLVLVRYADGHSVHNEWVYNGADIDGSLVVWAREMSPPEDAELRRYFSGRRVWLLEADKEPARLVEYEAGEPSA